MPQNTTIQLSQKVVQELKKSREYPEQTYNSLIEKMLEAFKTAKKSDQYDKFLHEVQKRKMRELWDNKEDEDWEHA